jgi:hypothetical protein
MTTAPNRSVDPLAGVNPRTIGACSWCGTVVRWVNTPASRSGQGVVLALDPAPDADGDVVLAADGVTATVLSGTDTHPDTTTWRRHHVGCVQSPRARSRATAAASVGGPCCEACGWPMDPTLSVLGETTHPCCDRRGHAAQTPRRYT